MGTAAGEGVQDDAPKREAILRAALELFAERGFHGTPVPLVAERAQVGAGTIYRYFESKEALVNALFQRWKRALADAVVSDFPFEAPAREQFHVYWRRMTEFVLRHPEAFAFLEGHHHAPYLDERSRAIEEEVLALARAFIAKTTAEQITKPLQAEVLMAVVFGAFTGVVKASWQGLLELTPEALDAAEACAWEAIRL